MGRSVLRAKLVQPPFIVRNLASFELYLGNSQGKGIQNDWHSKIRVFNWWQLPAILR